MANEIRWIKITVNIFDDEKMSLIDALPEHDSIIVIWFKLLCLAGKQNNGGVFMMNDRIAYTDEMLATIFRRPLNTVRLALNTFEKYGMVEIVNNVVTIPNWNKHQSLDAYEKKKQQDRERVARKRAEQRALAEMSHDTERQVAECRSLDKEEDIDIDKEKDIDISSPACAGDGLDEFSPQLQDAIHKWLVYKSERREKYKPTGLACLLTQIKNKTKEFGEDAVADVILNSMSSGYKGITFDRLKTKHTEPGKQKPSGFERGGNGFHTSNPFLEMYKEERGGE